jgi:hypothetical protein
MTKACESMRAAAQAAQPYPSPTAELDSEKLKKQLHSLPDNSSYPTQSKFEFFPFLPIKVRHMIWKLGTPRPDVLKVSIHGCRRCLSISDVNEYADQSEQDDSDTEGGDSRKESLPSFTYSAWEEFADFSITECCKEARHISCSLLPRSLATVPCEPRIRFDPAITAIYIHNFHDLLMTVDKNKGRNNLYDILMTVDENKASGTFHDLLMARGGNKESNTGEGWFCKDSCIGVGITTLVVHEARFWNQWPDTSLEWRSAWRWVGVLRKMFKDVDTVVAWGILECPWSFTDAALRYWENKDAVQAEDENKDAATQRATDQENVDSSTNSAQPRREKFGQDCWFDVDLFEKKLNNFFEVEVVDVLKEDCCFDPSSPKYRKRPQLKFHESADISKRLDKFSLRIGSK